MDMRDPWAQIERLIEAHASPVWLRLARENERAAIANASLIIANTERARDQLVARYRDRAADIITVTNGSDDDPLPPQQYGQQFVIAHAGTLYLDRDPRALFQAAARVIRELDLTPRDIKLAFVGELEAVGGFPIREVAIAEGISEYVETGPSRPHAEAMKFMAEATMLVTMSGMNVASIPAKTFEVVRFPAWVLALSAPDSATERLLRGTGADIASPGDVDAIADVIRSRYLEYKGGGRPAAIGDDPRFSRRFQSEILFDALEARVLPKGRDAHHALLR